MPDWVRDQIELIIERQVAPRFTLHSGLEGRLLTAATEMAAEHLPKVRRLMHDWAMAAATDPALQGYAIQVAHARLANAFALWELDSLGPEHDTRMLKALGSRGACFRGHDDRASELEARLLRLRSLSDDELEQALRDERELLARWGTPRRWEAPRRPFPVEAEIRRLRAGVGQAVPPLSPVLTMRLLSPDKQFRLEPEKVNPAMRCALQQWALWGALQQAGSELERRAALARWREGLKMDAASLIWTTAEEAGKPQAADNPYPRLAWYFQAGGEVDLHLELDAQGRLLDSYAAGYRLKVLGLPADERPAAFESLLEYASQQVAKGLSIPAGFGEKRGNRWHVTQPFRWNLHQ